MKKYELTSETKNQHGVTLHRIKALKNFGAIRQGEVGGWIEQEDNLSHSGNCWVRDNAIVGDNAIVRDHAKVCGNAVVRDNANITISAHYVTVLPIGSREDCTTFYRNADGGISVSCGCFTGTIEEFEKAVEETHGNNKYSKVYRKAIELAKLQITGENEDNRKDIFTARKLH